MTVTTPAIETKNIGELIEFQVQFMTMMLNVGRQASANHAIQKILVYCDYLKTQDLDVEVVKDEEKIDN